MKGEIIHCGTCRHWGEGEEPIVGFDRDGKRHCGMVYPDHERKTHLMLIEAGDFASSSGSLWTDKRFCCVLWEGEG